MTSTAASATAVDQAWVERYLRLLGVDPEPPSRAALGASQPRTSATIPFENLSSILSAGSVGGAAPPPLDPRVEAAKLGAGPRWRRLLRGRGHALATAAGPRLSRAADPLPDILPGSHQAVVVDLEGDRYLLDTGNGAPFFDAIALDGTVELRGAGLAYRFHAGEAPESWIQDRWIDGNWQPFCHYDLREPQPGARAGRLSAPSHSRPELGRRHPEPGALQRGRGARASATASSRTTRRRASARSESKA